MCQITAQCMSVKSVQDLMVTCLRDFTRLRLADTCCPGEALFASNKPSVTGVYDASCSFLMFVVSNRHAAFIRNKERKAHT